jgi:hypothetical protein
MGSGAVEGRMREEPKAEGKGMDGRGEAGAEVGAGGEARRAEVGEGRGMSQDRRRWPDLPHPRQTTGSLQPETLCCLRGARQRKQVRERERRGERLGVEGGAGVLGERRASRYEGLVAAWVAMNGGVMSFVSRPAPSAAITQTPLPSERHEGVAACPAMP